ncbi:hypothetical protein [Agrococcus baldri]|uniref:Uncharacterized protein n=1 Tax=Agrococcus baldri TaxID=153730 RepID=A0AA87RKU4_9MICO|nr:hypothetical protein [Agrococcus baldri]GEK79992.1 hypothetical protein ABA31_13430 [Agrococcus baldri]
MSPTAPRSIARTTARSTPAAALALGGALLALVAAPVLQHRRAQPVDGFPLSHYPMFSARRGRTGRVVHVVVDDADGTHPVHYRRLGTGGFNQVRRQLTRRARTPEGAAALAQEALERLGAERVRVVRSTFEYERFFAGDRSPERVQTLGLAERSGEPAMPRTDALPAQRDVLAVA